MWSLTWKMIVLWHRNRKEEKGYEKKQADGTNEHVNLFGLNVHFHPSLLSVGSICSPTCLRFRKAAI